MNENNQKQNVLLVLGILAIIGVFGGLTYAFFNYTRTGSVNTLKTGRISFTSNPTVWSNSNPTDKTYAHVDGGESNPGYFTYKAY